MHTRSRILCSYTVTNFFFFLCLLTMPQNQSREDDNDYINCKRTYNCGNMDLPYPFWGPNKPNFCGRHGFEVMCLSPDMASIQIGSQTFNVMRINPISWTVKMVRADIPSYDNCSFHFTNTSLDPALFSYGPSVENMTLFYDCASAFSIGHNNITCRDDSLKQAFFVNQAQLGQLPQLSQNCSVQIQVPITMVVTVDPLGGIESLRAALDKGFDAQYVADWRYCSSCMESGGACGSVDDGSLFKCYCPDGYHDLMCPVLASMASVSVLCIMRISALFCSVLTL